MQNSKIANYIVYDLSKKIYRPSSLTVNPHIINQVVENWDKQIYIVPNDAVKLHRYSKRKYELM